MFQMILKCSKVWGLLIEYLSSYLEKLMVTLLVSGQLFQIWGFFKQTQLLVIFYLL